MRWTWVIASVLVLGSFSLLVTLAAVSRRPHLRSQSRLGLADRGVNRRRLGEIRRAFAAAQGRD